MPTRLIDFHKYQGLGNDFVILDFFSSSSSSGFAVTSDLARSLCHRRLGVGCDQILVVTDTEGEMEKTAGVDAAISIFNADGSSAEACGNGTRQGPTRHSRVARPWKAEFAHPNC